MSDKAKKFIDSGTGVYQISRADAGETYRAAKKVKVYEFSYWKRNKSNKSQDETANRKDICGIRRNA